MVLPGFTAPTALGRKTVKTVYFQQYTGSRFDNRVYPMIPNDDTLAGCRYMCATKQFINMGDCLAEYETPEGDFETCFSRVEKSYRRCNAACDAFYS